MTPIHAVQGASEVSPLEGQVVTIAGVVSGDFQSGDRDALRDLGGFFVQEELPDGNPDTSDGIFIHENNVPLTDVSAGDRVTVVGAVTEHFGETRIVATSVAKTGIGEVQATILQLPSTPTMTNNDGLAVADLERFEGMLVKLVDPLFVNDLYYLQRFGEIGLSVGGTW